MDHWSQQDVKAYRRKERKSWFAELRRQRIPIMGKWALSSKGKKMTTLLQFQINHNETTK